MRKIDQLDVRGKRVLMRVDFNVPLTPDGKITDDTRIRASLPSIRWVLENGGSLILMSHLGRPKGEVKPELSLAPCAEHLATLLKTPVHLVSDFLSEPPTPKPGEVYLLENIRFYKEETKPELDPTFAKKLAQIGDVYVNDAFGTAHREHASTVSVAKHFDEAAAGFLMLNEVKQLRQLIDSPKRPFVALIGGAKVSSKLGVIEALADQVDSLLIGGGMAFTFLKAKGLSIGNSLVEEEMIEAAKRIMNKTRCHLPIDAVCAQAIDSKDTQIHSSEEGIPQGWMGLDIGPESIEQFKRVLAEAATILWNGPVGAFEFAPFAHGTLQIAHFLADHRGVTVAGGGDSLAAIKQAGVGEHFTHLSTGGGASLEFIEKQHLPGIDVLDRQLQN